jgi:hypothetical protein
MAISTVVCPRCETVATADSVFCTACGTALHAGLIDPDNNGTASTMVGRPVPLAHPASHPVETGSRGWISRKRLVAVVATLCAVAAVAALAVEWRAEAGAHHAAASKAASLTAQLVVTRGHLASARADLARTTKIAAQRQAVLLQADSTLKKVDPLLSQVDQLKNAASQDEQANSDWGDSLSDAYNYLNNNMGAIDWSYADSLVDNANQLLTSAQAAESNYARVADGFGAKADAFTQSVRLLQRQLKTATAG